MDEKIIDSVRTQVCKLVPALENSVPEIHPQPNDTYLIIFKSSAKTIQGNTLPLVMRVTIDSNGKILKQSMSR